MLPRHVCPSGRCQISVTAGAGYEVSVSVPLAGGEVSPHWEELKRPAGDRCSRDFSVVAISVGRRQHFWSSAQRCLSERIRSLCLSCFCGRSLQN